MKDYKGLYIQLCAMKLDNPMDYTDKHKVRGHNSAMRELNSLCEDLKTNIPYAIELLSCLLTNENEQVRLIAASHCLKLNICQYQAKAVLLDIQRNSNNRFNSFDAEMILKSL